MMKKTVSFDVYLSNFYPFIKVHDQNDGEHDLQMTPIFYNIYCDNLTICFAYYQFYIETSVGLNELKQKYNGELENDWSGNNISFDSWINKKYMDERGIYSLN